MKLSLLVTKGFHPQPDIPINTSPFVIGRSRDCHVQLACGEVSRRHCALEVRSDQVLVSDLTSTNGTFVNGRRLCAESELHPGDCLEIGSLVLVLRKEVGTWVDDGPTQTAGTAEGVEAGDGADTLAGIRRESKGESTAPNAAGGVSLLPARRWSIVGCFSEKVPEPGITRSL
jgi:predicted component of type VI protein secretion system